MSHFQEQFLNKNRFRSDFDEFLIDILDDVENRRYTRAQKDEKNEIYF